MANLIPIGTTTSAWFDVAVTATTPQQAWIFDAAVDAATDSGPTYQVAYKTSGGNYNVIGQNMAQAGYFNQPGVYGVRRLANGYTSGLDLA